MAPALVDSGRTAPWQRRKAVDNIDSEQCCAGCVCSPPPAQLRGKYLAARKRGGTVGITARCPGHPDIRKVQVGTNLCVAILDQDGVGRFIEY